MSQTRGKGVKGPDGFAREKLFSVCCMLYGVCVFGALGLYLAAACCLLLLLPGTWCMCPAARNLMFLHHDHNVDWTRDTPEPDAFTL